MRYAGCLLLFTVAGCLDLDGLTGGSDDGGADLSVASLADLSSFAPADLAVQSSLFDFAGTVVDLSSLPDLWPPPMDAATANDLAACGGGGPCTNGLTCCNGVCVDEANDIANCGGCNAPCALVAHGSPRCSNSSCKIGTCDTGYLDCDFLVANGCEVFGAVDINNCGACGNQCNLANAVSVCGGGKCFISVCKAGFGNCNNVADDGCESDLNNGPSCGMCGMACVQGLKCVAGKCM